MWVLASPDVALLNKITVYRAWKAFWKSITGRLVWWKNCSDYTEDERAFWAARCTIWRTEPQQFSRPWAPTWENEAGNINLNRLNAAVHILFSTNVGQIPKRRCKRRLSPTNTHCSRRLQRCNSPWTLHESLCLSSQPFWWHISAAVLDV